MNPATDRSPWATSAEYRAGESARRSPCGSSGCSFNLPELPCVERMPTYLSAAGPCRTVAVGDTATAMATTCWMACPRRRSRVVLRLFDTDRGANSHWSAAGSGSYHLTSYYNRKYGRGDCLTAAELRELTDWARGRTGRADDARRARVILLLAEGLTWDVVRERAQCNRGFVAMWARRFRAERLARLYSRHRGQRPFRCTLSAEATILNATRKPPTDGCTHGSTRRLAAKLGCRK